MRKWFSFFKNTVGIISAFIGFVFVFIPLSEATPSNIKSRLFIILGILVVAILISVVWMWCDNRGETNEVYSKGTTRICFEYGKIEKAFEFSKNSIETITFVISINTNIQVSSEIAPIKKGSLHRWALEKIEGKVDGNFIKELKVKNDGFDINGRKGDWFIVPPEKLKEKSNVQFLFIEVFDIEQRNGQWSNKKIAIDDYLVVLQRMIMAICDNLNKESKVYLPLVGAGVGDVGKPEDILQLTANLLRFNKSRLIHEIHVLINENCKKSTPIHLLSKF
ncbi:MAG: hypothetical protein SOX82_01840 [Eubacteriales bacterium]|nr:hypothetical protein [Eubacteriales bacterium]